MESSRPFFPGNVSWAVLDEDLFEGGFHHLEASDAGAGDGLGEQGLGVVGQSRGGAELDLNVAVVAREVLDAGMVEEAVVALEADQDAVARVAGFDLAHGAGEDEMAAMDEGDAVAELLHLVHAVGGEEDGLADAAQVDQGAHEQE